MGKKFIIITRITKIIIGISLKRRRKKKYHKYKLITLPRFPLSVEIQRDSLHTHETRSDTLWNRRLLRIARGKQNNIRLAMRCNA